jgi:hypothetical protein
VFFEGELPVDRAHTCPHTARREPGRAGGRRQRSCQSSPSTWRCPQTSGRHQRPAVTSLQGEEGATRLTGAPQQHIISLLPSSLLGSLSCLCAHAATPQQRHHVVGHQAPPSQHLYVDASSTPYLALVLPADIYRPVTMMIEGPMRTHHPQKLCRFEPSSVYGGKRVTRLEGELAGATLTPLVHLTPHWFGDDSSPEKRSWRCDDNDDRGADPPERAARHGSAPDGIVPPAHARLFGTTPVASL